MAGNSGKAEASRQSDGSNVSGGCWQWLLAWPAAVNSQSDGPARIDKAWGARTGSLSLNRLQVKSSYPWAGAGCAFAFAPRLSRRLKITHTSLSIPFALLSPLEHSQVLVTCLRLCSSVAHALLIASAPRSRRHQENAQEKGWKGPGQGKAEGQGTERVCWWKAAMDEEVCQKLR